MLPQIPDTRKGAMKKVLITGASGFVGFHLLNEAIAADLEVYAAVRKNSDVLHLQARKTAFHGRRGASAFRL